MFVNDDGKFTEPAQYYYNTYIDMYCVVGKTFAVDDLSDLADVFENVELLEEIPMPSYICSAEYEGETW